MSGQTAGTATRTKLRLPVGWYVEWGTGTSGRLRQLKAHVREARPSTRLWMDIMLPLAVIAAVTNGDPPWRVTVLFVLAMLLLHYAATLLNDVQDAETDRHSDELLRRTRPIAFGTIPRRVAIIEIGACSLLGIAVATLVSWQLGVACAVLILLVSQHELPPLRTQSRPLLSPVAGLIGLAGIAFCICLAVSTVPDLAGYLFILFVVTYLGAAEMLVKDVRDVANDAQGGKQTTSVKYGAGRSAWLALGAYAAATACYVGYVGVTFAREPLVGAGLAVGILILLTWAALVVRIAVGLGRPRARPTLGRQLHRGSVITFSTVSFVVIAAQLGL